MTAPAIIAQLIATFDRNRESYRSAAYNEHQLRVEFLDPFFIALGWDVPNAAGYALPYRDVVHEDAIKVGVATKAPDYCFRVGGARKFFLEAKKPSLDIRSDPGPAFQLRRYAWSAKLPLSILSGFEDFAVYDCRIKPEPQDPAAAARVSLFHYTEYLERWPAIADVFSREAVLKGSFDQFAESSRLKKGTAEVDSAFLKEIESWRDSLAKNIAIRNPGLSQRELNFAVQATIDRIIFLRIGEDRGLENYGRLQALQNGTNIYQRLFHLFAEADDRYNSGLFHFRPEPDRAEPPDQVTPRLAVDDKPLKEILKRLYYPESPYEFSVLPADILGQVYEQFLGKIIRLTAGHQAKIEDKPEVKKAGGVYYTPTYIVDYIVKNTVGKLLEGKAPEQVSGCHGVKVSGSGKSRRKKQGGADIPPSRRTERFGGVSPVCHPLRILDPACGSGSFLLGAYQHLLDWYLEQYLKQGPEKHRNELYEIARADASFPSTGNQEPRTTNRSYRLTIAERKRILLDHIYGVDIDTQAVEVTKLSLLLKCLEGETEESIHQLKLFYKERALPDLSANIKCGNSLIGSDFYHGRQTAMFDQEEILRINAFDWHKEFPEVFPSPSPSPTGRGNPSFPSPTGGGQGEGLSSSAVGGKGEAGFDVVIGNPPYGYMIHEVEQEYFSQHFQHQDYQKDLYLLFLERYHHLLKQDALLGVIVSNTWLQSVNLRKIRQHLANQYLWLRILHLPEKVFHAVVDTQVLIFQKAESDQESLSVDVRKGTEIKLSHKLSLRELPTNGDPINIVFSSEKHHLFQKIQNISLPLNQVCDVYNGAKPFEEGKGNPPQTKQIMIEKPYVKEGEKPASDWSPLLRGSLMNRYHNLWEKNYWILYGPWLAAPRDPAIFEAPIKIIVRQTGDSIIATIIDKGFIARDNLHVLLPLDKSYDLRYVLGIMNSKLIDFAYTFINPEKGEALAQVKKKHVESLPIRTINFSIDSDKAHHDRMAELVDRILDLHQRKAAARVPAEFEALERQIAATDAEIDGLVYELYGLTDNEIEIVEGRE